MFKTNKAFKGCGLNYTISGGTRLFLVQSGGGDILAIIDKHKSNNDILYAHASYCAKSGVYLSLLPGFEGRYGDKNEILGLAVPLS